MTNYFGFIDETGASHNDLLGGVFKNCNDMLRYSSTRKNEINKWLQFIEKKNKLQIYVKRFNKKNQRNESLAEIFSAYFMEEKLGHPVIDWERPTIKGKNVDFVVSINGEEVYCEVKGPRWESELGEEERGARKHQPKYGKFEARHVALWSNYRYAIKRAYEKFIADKHNLLIIVDDLFLSFYDYPNSIDQALFEDKGVYGHEQGYFVGDNYRNLGGILFLNYTILGKIEYKIEFRDNPNALKPINDLLSVNSVVL